MVFESDATAAAWVCGTSGARLHSMRPLRTSPHELYSSKRPRGHKLTPRAPRGTREQTPHKRSKVTTQIGKAYLIGAGPGDPGLLTLRGRRLLGQADVVLYDYLANPRILTYAKPGAELVCLGRHGSGRILSQDEIHERMIAAACAGKTVARLKGGDVAIFGRAAEEVAALESAGVPYEIAPGVTAASAASGYTGIPLTHRAAASCVAFITGQECREKQDAALDMAALATFPGTLVFYMGVTSAPEWSAALIQHGKPADTPVAIVRHASLPAQKAIVTTLGALPRVTAGGKLRPPAILIVGDAVRERATLDWFRAQPLAGRTIMVTRPTYQADGMVDAFEALGAAVIVQPAIEIGPPREWAPVDAAITQLSSFAWIVFSSANGVHAFLDRLLDSGRDVRALGQTQIAAIGPATADALAEYRLRADVMPPEYRAEALADKLVPVTAGEHVLLVRASRGREVLAETLVAAGAAVTQVVAYESRDVATPDPDVAAALKDNRVDWITVTSSAIARSLVKLFGASLARAKLAAISPLTASILEEAGHEPAAVATEYTTAGLIAAILAAEAP
jgi:uroporphyrinogen III methyltransferase/synthase